MHYEVRFQKTLDCENPNNEWKYIHKFLTVMVQIGFEMNNMDISKIEEKISQCHHTMGRVVSNHS